MVKKKKPRRASISGKSQKHRKRTVHRSRKISMELKNVSKPEAVAQETVSGYATEETGWGASEPVRPLPVPMEKSDMRTPQGMKEAVPETAWMDSSFDTQRKANAREKDRITEVDRQGDDEILELLAFKLADEEYAVDILKIKEIIRPVEITRVPKRPPFIKGIISLRGTIIPIFDLRTRLGLAESSPSSHTRNLVVEVENGMIGLIADSVTEVVKVNTRDIEPPPVIGGAASSGHLKGVTRVNGHLVILLDIEKAIGAEDFKTAV
jgi:purine-binding chemotaxis protein CheW